MDELSFLGGILLVGVVVNNGIVLIDRAQQRRREGLPLRAAIAAAGGELRWVQVTRNPGHVYASHRAHVGVGGLSCTRCHGDVASWTRPPAAPDPSLTNMSRCIACHRREGAPTSCGTCHR